MLSLPVLLNPSPSSLLSHPAHYTAGREHSEKPSKLVCFPCRHRHLPKTSTAEPWRDILLLALQSKVQHLRWSWLSALSSTFATTAKVIYQPGCDPLFWNVTLWTVLLQLSCLRMVMWKWEELDFHTSELSITQLHTCKRFRAIQKCLEAKWAVVGWSDQQLVFYLHKYAIYNGVSLRNVYFSKINIL